MENLIFSSVFIGTERFNEYQYNSDKKFLTKLSQINIFIGMNNSGKSRFIRKLFSDGEQKFLSPVLDIIYIDKTLKNFIKEFNVLKKTGVNSLGSVDKQLGELAELEFNYLQRHNDFQVILKVLNSISEWFSKNITPLAAAAELKAKDLTEDTFKELRKIIPKDNNVTTYKYENIYIPTLRGLRPIQTIGSDNKSFTNQVDNYFFRTILDYFELNENYKDQIYTGLSLYTDLQKYSHGGDSDTRGKLKGFENFLSETFFNNEEVELIPVYNKDAVNVRIGKTEEPIHNLGDGIQALIVLTYPLFFNRGKELKVYIEEPEVHLHPGFQRKYLETLLRPEFKTFQYFITTHSNHFLI